MGPGSLGGPVGNTILRYIRGTTGLCRWLGSPAIALVEANQIPIQGVREPVLRVATRADPSFNPLRHVTPSLVLSF